jgi:hypothetical protein
MTLLSITPIVFLTLGMSSIPLHGQTTKKTPAPVKAPAAVVDAFKKAYPTAQLKNVTSEKEDGKVEYELETVDGTIARNVIYTADGKLVETEDGITATQIPKVVVDAVSKKYPKGTLSKIEKVKSAAGVVSYEMVVTTGGKKATVEVDEKGKIQ